MTWPNLVIIITSFFSLGANLSGKSIKTNFQDNFRTLAESSGLIVHSFETNSQNQFKTIISFNPTSPKITAYFNQSEPLEIQLALLQTATKIATMKSKRLYLIDFTTKKPYATLKNN